MSTSDMPSREYASASTASCPTRFSGIVTPCSAIQSISRSHSGQPQYAVE